MTEKLLTLKEAADYLGVSEEEIRRLVDKGEIPAYQIGGMYLRFKEEQILSLKAGYRKRYIGAPKDIIEEPDGRRDLLSKVKDFFYFNDFYIISAVITGLLIYVILNSIK